MLLSEVALEWPLNCDLSRVDGDDAGAEGLHKFLSIEAGLYALFEIDQLASTSITCAILK